MVHSVPSWRLAVLVSLGLLAWSLAAPAAAQWAWKDDNGRVVYSDRPPPSAVKGDRIVRQPSNAQTVLPPQQGATDPTAKPATDAKPVAASSGPKSVAEQEMEFRKRQQERADAEKKTQDDQVKVAAKAAECERARGYLKGIEEGQRIVRSDASGNREYLDDSQRAAEAERTRKIVQSSCS
ncbi:MAG TPA: DUF4124 domain-containing protein [Burkholderiaceae bacterium]|nr:DUF4124 domain-containing protein [Burkholderiaceae bacterium]